MFEFFRPKTDARPDARLEDRLARIERRLDTIDVEWSGWFDKFRRLYARIAKRVERQDDPDDAGKPGNDARHDGASTHSLPARRSLRGF